MGVIINGQERKSVAEQVEENSKYKGRFIGTGDSLTLYKKDLPCFIRVFVKYIQSSEKPVQIKAGNGTVLYDIKMSNLWRDYIIIGYGDNGVRVYEITTSGNFSDKTGSNGYYDDVLEIYRNGASTYYMIIPLRY